MTEDDDNTCFVCDQRLVQYILIHRKSLLNTTKVERWCLACVCKEGLEMSKFGECQDCKDKISHWHGDKAIWSDEIPDPLRPPIVEGRGVGIANSEDCTNDANGCNNPDHYNEDKLDGWDFNNFKPIDPNPNNDKVAVTIDEINHRIMSKLVKDLWHESVKDKAEGMFKYTVPTHANDAVSPFSTPRYNCSCEYCESKRDEKENKVIGVYTGAYTTKAGDPVKVEINPNIDKLYNSDYDVVDNFFGSGIIDDTKIYLDGQKVYGSEDYSQLHRFLNESEKGNEDPT